MNRLPGQITAWWYYPRNGRSYHIGEINNLGTKSSITPLAGHDWVLVLDKLVANSPEP